MNDDIKICFLNVPLNARGEVEHDYYDPPDMPNVWTMIISRMEYRRLLWVFEEWNESFNLFIDIFEEEKLPRERTREALAILEHHMRERPESEFLEAAQKLKIALNKAIELDMPLYLDF